MPKSDKKVTLKEVAKHLGVSTATVSNAFNRPDQLSPELRDRILTESSSLGYNGPNLAARSLRRGKSDVIGVVLADSLSYSFSDPVASQLLQGIAEELAVNNKQMLLLSSEENTAEQHVAESLPDGFIFYGTPQKECFERILRNGRPCIAVDFEQHSIGTVNIDNYAAAKTIAHHAITQSNKHPAVIGMRIIDSDRVCRLLAQDLANDSTEISRRRLAGYMDAAEESGVTIPVEKVWHIPVNKPDSAEIAAREMLTMSPRPDVVLCMSDVIALAVIRVAQNMGLNVPDDIRVVGFDDIPEASRVSPGLTTICQQSLEKGRLATKRLLSGDVTGNTELKTRLIARSSG